MARAFWLVAYFTSRPSKVSTETMGYSARDTRHISIRSSMVNRDFLKALVATATMIRSKIFKARWIRSRWPLVMGSNEPGYTAISGIS